MSHKTRGRIRTLFAVPSAAVLMFSASHVLASPMEPSRVPDCTTFCADAWEFCEANPTVYRCRYCGC